MSREDARTKGLRYLTEGRLCVRSIGPQGIAAWCRDAGELYRCGFDPGRGWWCECPALGRCSHLWALETVTVRPMAQGAAP